MILIYLVFFFLILRFTVTLFNFISNPKLTNSGREFNDKISILIPARNEQHNILNLLQSIQDQDYSNFEVLILDDNSTDNTFSVCEIFCHTDSRFRVIAGAELPVGWLGKNFACCQLAEAASGNYFIFLDADELVSNGLFNNAIHRMKQGKLDLLSLFTNQIMRTPGELLVVPMMHFILLNLLPLRLVRLSKNPAFAAASGQFMMFTAANYRENQWHELAKAKVVEDIEIMKYVKGLGYRAETLLANGFIHCRMYRGLKESVDGFSKNILAGFNNSVAGLLLYLLLVVLGPIVISSILTAELILFGATLIVLSRVMISLLAGQNIWYNIILHPIQIALMVWISFLSIQKHYTRSVNWKGRNIRNAG